MSTTTPTPPSPEVTEQARQRFLQNAVADPATGELALNVDQFLDTVAPVGEDYHKIPREQFRIFFPIADRQGRGRVDLADWAFFEGLLRKPDAEYEMAFRLFDVGRAGTVRYEDFRRLYELNKSPDSIPFNWDCEWARLYIGDKSKRHDLDYHQFSQMLRGLQGERIRQAFQTLDTNGDGYIEPAQFERIILETSRHKLSDHMLSHLRSLCAVGGSEQVSYASVRAFQNIVRDMDHVELIVRSACARSADGTISRDDFLAQASRMARFSQFTPMEADVLFHFASTDPQPGASASASARLGVDDFAKVVDPSWRRRERAVDAISAAGAAAAAVAEMRRARTPVQKAVAEVAESAYNFGLGSIAGAFGAFMVYPIDLVKTRMQNQRSGKASASGVNKVVYKNSIDCFRKVVANEGFLGLYSGVLPQLIGVAPEKAIKLTVNDLVRNWATAKDGSIWPGYEVLAGGSAGMCQVIFTNPLEIIKIRLQMEGETAKEAGAVRKGAIGVANELGFRGVYRGVIACLLRDVPFSAIYFPTYNHLKKDFFGESPDHKLGVMQLLTAGAIAGMPAAYLTTPADVVKTRLQTKHRSGETVYRNVRHAFRTVWHEEGFRAFFKGGVARIMRSSPQFGFTLAAYEVLQTTVPYPSAAKELREIRNAAALREAGSQPTPFVRSRNALKIILDLDEDFGKVKLPDQQAWQSLPAAMGGKRV